MRNVEALLARQFHHTPPAITALFIQFAAFIVVALALFLLWQSHHLTPNLLELALSQSALSFVLTLFMTRWFGLAWWWCVIQPAFPLAILLMLALMLPPVIYLLLFSLLLGFYWSTFCTQVPYFPSTQRMWREVEKLLPEQKAISFVDIGSGLGGLVLYLGKKYPESQFLGVEIAPLPWLLSHLRTIGQDGNVRFLRSNYQHMCFSQFDVIFAYLSPAAMPDLWIKAKNEMRPGSLLISAEFPVPGIEADLCIDVENNYSGQIKNGMYVYTHF